jgi:hypothetical protein
MYFYQVTRLYIPEDNIRNNQCRDYLISRIVVFHGEGHDDGGITFIRNTCKFMPDYVTSHPRT